MRTESLKERETLSETPDGEPDREPDRDAVRSSVYGISSRVVPPGGGLGDDSGISSRVVQGGGLSGGVFEYGRNSGGDSDGEPDADAIRNASSFSSLGRTVESEGERDSGRDSDGDNFALLSLGFSSVCSIGR